MFCIPVHFECIYRWSYVYEMSYILYHLPDGFIAYKRDIRAFCSTVAQAMASSHV